MVRCDNQDDNMRARFLFFFMAKIEYGRGDGIDKSGLCTRDIRSEEKTLDARGESIPASISSRN